MRKLATSQFGMAIGNLGTEIFDYACFDYTDNKESLYKYAYQLLDTALTYEDSIVHPNAKAFIKVKLIFSMKSIILIRMIQSTMWNLY